MEPIIDIHTHLGDSPSLGFSMTAAQLIGAFEEYGVERAVVMPFGDAPGQDPTANDVVAEAMDQHPDRFIGFARIHPKDGEQGRDEFRRCVEELGLKGLKLHPLTTGTRVNDADSLRLVEMAVDYGVPVYYHSGDDPSTQPTMFEFVVRAVPEATVILGHAGGHFFWRDAADMAARHPNVYLSTPGSVSPANMERSIAIAGAEKVLFGSDAPAMHHAVELAKLEAVDLPDARRHLIMYENARRVLSL